jgi:hypothetical protein
MRSHWFSNVFLGAVLCSGLPCSARETLKHVSPTQRPTVVKQLHKVYANQKVVQPIRYIPPALRGLQSGKLKGLGGLNSLQSLSSRTGKPSPFLPTSITPLTTINSLDHFVMLQKCTYPQACVVAGFYDWRTTSRWRSRAGLHFGYDIAMPYGTPFVSGWSGVVTSIVPWYGEEYGITLALADGNSVTYGHVSPAVKVGDTVQVGQVTGFIRLDHVDVKMRDNTGNFVDFGNGKSSTLNMALLTSAPMPAIPTKEAICSRWLWAKTQVDSSREEVAELQEHLLKIKLQRTENEQLIAPLQQETALIEKLKLVDPQLMEKKLIDETKIQERYQKLLALQDGQKRLTREISLLEKQVKQQKESFSNQVKEMINCEIQATSVKLSWSDVERFVSSHVATAQMSKIAKSDELSVTKMQAQQVAKYRQRRQELSEKLELSRRQGPKSMDTAVETKLLEDYLELIDSKLNRLQSQTGDWFFKS